LTTKDVGDYGVWTLTVTPAGGDTAAVLTVISPAGITTTPGQTSTPDKSVWTSTPTSLGVAGEWVGRWTVTGTGAGVEADQTMLVAPTTPVTEVVYATTTDLANHLHTAPPAGSRRLLARATLRVDELLLTAVYDVDTNGLPTNAAVIVALRRATCEQAEWMTDVGDADGTGVAEVYQSVSIGRLALTRAGTATGGSQSLRYAPNAVQVLRRAGLITGDVFH
jgi:hypothetical protein